jgi:hypothetical protein
VLTVVGYVPDLMDRSRLQGVVDRFVPTADALQGEAADIVVIDLSRPGVLDVVPALAARVVAFGRHDNVELLDAARAAGCAVVLARSKFFADPAGAIAVARSAEG